ncbi:hypothetical protein [Blastopirellula marina]|uniref:Uncharacterized protein n=1 Tax=Blastopirellula marina TaxID=124 RepID=A0A2S8FTA8_9BACT|nr:hypothetical protein [Blastopirellula marina]PQO35418.1 hypothetical protein C5Y98_13730 [Blastopirellula marina]PTL44058.1 hypothetical protein C5Y97_13740 [Blastopirellula marina]
MFYMGVVALFLFVVLFVLPLIPWLSSTLNVRDSGPQAIRAGCLSTTALFVFIWGAALAFCVVGLILFVGALEYVAQPPDPIQPAGVAPKSRPPSVTERSDPHDRAPSDAKTMTADEAPPAAQ